MHGKTTEPIVQAGRHRPAHDWKRRSWRPPYVGRFRGADGFPRLHRYRLGRTRQALSRSPLDLSVLRPIQSLHHLDRDRQLARDKFTRYALLPARRAASVGFRLGGKASPPFRALAAQHNCHAGMLDCAAPSTRRSPDAQGAEEIKSISRSTASPTTDRRRRVEPAMMFERRRSARRADGQQICSTRAS